MVNRNNPDSVVFVAKLDYLCTPYDDHCLSGVFGDHVNDVLMATFVCGHFIGFVVSFEETNSTLCSHVDKCGYKAWCGDP